MSANGQRPRAASASIGTLYAGFASTVGGPRRTSGAISSGVSGRENIRIEREPELWWKSFANHQGRHRGEGPPEMKPWFEMVNLVITDQTFHGDMEKENALKVYNAHNAEVKRTIPAAKRLDFDPLQGWPPLCKFLGVPIPATDFPKTNSHLLHRRSHIARGQH
jgi:hypothetical protein